jgi:hypothetical protein
MAVPGDVLTIIEVSIVAVAEASSGLCRTGRFAVSKSGVSPIGRIIFSRTNFFPIAFPLFVGWHQSLDTYNMLPKSSPILHHRPTQTWGLALQNLRQIVPMCYTSLPQEHRDPSGGVTDVFVVVASNARENLVSEGGAEFCFTIWFDMFDFILPIRKRVFRPVIRAPLGARAYP